MPLVLIRISHAVNDIFIIELQQANLASTGQETHLIISMGPISRVIHISILKNISPPNPGIIHQYAGGYHLIT